MGFYARILEHERRIMEKIKNNYTNFILTVIAVGILGLNYYMFDGKIISEAKAASESVQKVAICDNTGSRCAAVGGVDGKGYNVLLTVVVE